MGDGALVVIYLKCVWMLRTILCLDYVFRVHIAALHGLAESELRLIRHIVHLLLRYEALLHAV